MRLTDRPGLRGRNQSPLRSGQRHIGGYSGQVANSAEVEIDRQGRMPIPAHLRTFAGLDAEVLVHGAIDRLELWNPGAWTERVLPEESWLLEGDGD